MGVLGSISPACCRCCVPFTAPPVWQWLCQTARCSSGYAPLPFGIMALCSVASLAPFHGRQPQPASAHWHSMLCTLLAQLNCHAAVHMLQMSTPRLILTLTPVTQVPPTIQEEDCAVPKVRRSFSEPSVVGRRGALELTRESLDQMCARRGFAMAGAHHLHLHHAVRVQSLPDSPEGIVLCYANRATCAHPQQSAADCCDFAIEVMVA